jgi:hypothetical protein
MSAQYINLNAINPVTDEDVELVDEQLDDQYTYHAWTIDKIEAGNQVRNALKAAAKAIIVNVPASADRSAALRKLREARMDANSAITHGGKY